MNVKRQVLEVTFKDAARSFDGDCSRLDWNSQPLGDLDCLVSDDLLHPAAVTKQWL